MARLGQHFLVDRKYVEIALDAADVGGDDVVLEIGPGKGALTSGLLERGARVVAVEKDPFMVRYLRKRFSEEIERGTLHLVEGDALRVEFPPFNKVVSNIPYEISSPLTFRLLDYGFEVGVIMYQMEFAVRMTAPPGWKEYSRLSVSVQYRADVEIVEIVPRTAFRPPPKVDSAIVKIVPKEPEVPVEDEKLFDEVLRLLFSHRRKKIKNVLGMDVPYGDFRVEELEVPEIVELVNYLHAKEKGK